MFPYRCLEVNGSTATLRFGALIAGDLACRGARPVDESPSVSLDADAGLRLYGACDRWHSFTFVGVWKRCAGSFRGHSTEL